MLLTCKPLNSGLDSSTTESGGLFRADRNAEAHPLRCDLARLYGATQIVPGADGMFDDNGAGRVIFVAEGVGFLLQNFTVLGEHAVLDGDARDALWVAGLFGAGCHGESVA